MSSHSIVSPLSSLCLFTALSCAGQTLDSLYTSMVYLRQPFTNTVVKDGVTNEVWLTTFGKKDFAPDLRFSTGSGALFIASNHFYLVTANHVANAMLPSADAVVRGPNDTPVLFKLSDVSFQRTNFHWFNDPNADLSVLPLDITNPELRTLLTEHFLPAATLVQELRTPDREDLVVVLGFPLDLGISGKFSPISKHSRPSSGLLTLTLQQPPKPAIYFLLEDPSAAGYSGAPVFSSGALKLRGPELILGQTKLECYGIVTSTFSDATGGKFTAVVPSKFIFEKIIELEKLIWGQSPSP